MKITINILVGASTIDDKLVIPRLLLLYIRHVFMFCTGARFYICRSFIILNIDGASVAHTDRITCLKILSMYFRLNSNLK